MNKDQWIIVGMLIAFHVLPLGILLLADRIMKSGRHRDDV